MPTKKKTIKAWAVIRAKGRIFKFIPDNEVWPSHYSSAVFVRKIDAEQIAKTGSHLERAKLKVIRCEIRIIL